MAKNKQTKIEEDSYPVTYSGTYQPLPKFKSNCKNC
jgi:hypothetical protein